MKNESGVYDVNFSELVAIAAYVTGVVVAKGGWSTFFSIVFFPYAWYLTIEFFFKLAGWM